jgi:hypothetical protein
MGAKKKLVKTTTSRHEFNRAYKMHLEHSGEIYCSRCPYHGKENQDHKSYGGFEGENINVPSWKLVSKNGKQWMRKPIKYVKSTGWYNNRTYVEIKFST